MICINALSLSLTAISNQVECIYAVLNIYQGHLYLRKHQHKCRPLSVDKYVLRMCVLINILNNRLDILALLPFFF